MGVIPTFVDRSAESYNSAVTILQLKECQTSVRKNHAEYKKSLSERDPADISKEFSIRCKLRQLNLSIQEHDGLVEKQREIERSITELEENPPRYKTKSL